MKRVMIKGFIVRDHADRTEAFLRDCGAWVKGGQIRYREDVVEGLEAAPDALRRLLEGRNFGKQLVRVAHHRG